MVGDMGSGLPARAVTSYVPVLLILDLRCTASDFLPLDPCWATCLSLCLCGSDRTQSQWMVPDASSLGALQSRILCPRGASHTPRTLLQKACKFLSKVARPCPKPQGSKILTFWPFTGPRSPTLKSDDSKLGITATAVSVGSLVG